jgi:hypothetical protein
MLFLQGCKPFATVFAASRFMNSKRVSCFGSVDRLRADAPEDPRPETHSQR